MALAQPRYFDPGEITIAGLSRRHTPATMSTLHLQWAEAQSQLGGAVGVVGGDAFGVWYDVLQGGPPFTYIAGVRFGEFAPIHPGFSRAILRGLHCAAFAHQGPVTELRNTVDAILTQWLPASGRELSKDEGQPDFIEHYSEEFNQTGMGLIEIWLPIKRK